MRRNDSWLVTGAGFLASHLTRQLIARGVEVTNLVRSMPTTAPTEANPIVCPLEELTPSVFAGFHFDVVAHLAAFTPKRHEDANDAVRIIAANVVGTEKLVNSLPSAPRTILFTSTIDVYARPHSVLRESHPVGPSDVYGSSKLMGERLILAAAPSLGSRASCLRIGHLYGAGESKYRKLVPVTIDRVLDGVPPTIYGDGEAKVDLLHVSDAVEAICRAGDPYIEPPPILNVMGAPTIAIRDVVRAIVDAAQCELETEYEPTNSPMPSSEVDDRFMVEVLGTWSKMELDKGIAEEVSSRRIERLGEL